MLYGCGSGPWSKKSKENEPKIVESRNPVFKSPKTIFIFVLILAGALWGCGKKALPVAPESSAPEAVADLRAWVKEEEVFLSWGFPSRNKDGTRLDDLRGFRVLRQTRPLGPSSCPECPLKIDTVGRIDLQFPREGRVEGRRAWWQDRSLNPQNEYLYTVVGYNRSQTSGAESNRVKISFAQPPAAVGQVKIKPDDRLLEVSWDFEPRLKNGEIMNDPGGFNVYRRSGGGDFGFLPVNPEPISQSPYRDVRLENGKRYEYVVRALRNFHGTLIEGPASVAETGVPEKTVPPSEPTGLSGAMRREAGKMGVELRWNRNPEADIVGYDLYRREKGAEPWRKLNSQIIADPFFFDATADPRKTYIYRLKAIDNSPRRNQSEFSREEEVTP
jgi:hypothetical protein